MSPVPRTSGVQYPLPDRRHSGVIPSGLPCDPYNPRRRFLALTPGTRLGVYEVTAQIGVGGMGEVYRARDTRLKRDVALKILPESFASDPERLARFQREAEVLASLNHPHIAAIYGLEDADGVKARVMELVEGEDLSQRIARGAIPLDETLSIAVQIADALEAAHEQGMIHRDLKPANIMRRPDGIVKILDFGLAKAMASPPGTTPTHSLANSPTMTSPPAMTGVGVLLGTAAYMSPEQAKGQPANQRCDVWSFGCVFYEMLTGRRAFHGDDVADTLAAVLKGSPDWTALPVDTPPAVRTLIQGCLRRDRKERIGAISTALFVIRHPPSEESHPPVSSVRRPVWQRAIGVVAAALVGAALTAAVLSRQRPSPVATVTRFTITLPQGQALTVNRRPVALSPDGTRIVYAANNGLFMRSTSEFDARPILGADPGITPAFSPDGQSLVFYADSSIKRIAVAGGTAVTICHLDVSPSSIAWSGDHILFTDAGTAIERVSSKGGMPEMLVDVRASEDQVYGPQLLPDGDTLLFSVVKRTGVTLDGWQDGQIVMHSLKTGRRKTLIEGGGDARYVPTGHIVYASAGTLFAMAFDLSTLAVTGGAVPVVEDVGVGGSFGVGRTAHYAFSDSGVLVYVPAPPSAGQSMLFVDRKGATESLKLPSGRYEFPRVSPDGKRIVFGTSDGKEAVVSIYELSGVSSVRRLTFGSNNRFPVWSADGRQIAFQSDREGDAALFEQPADGGPAERLTKPDPGTFHVPESWSPDGQVLLFSVTKNFTTSLWTLSLRDRAATPFGDVSASSLPTDAIFSPDGRWVAYQTGRAGVVEGTTYVQPFPPTGAKYEVAAGGRPLWSRDGKELLFVTTPGRLMVVTVKATAPTFMVTSPVAIPRGFGAANPSGPRTFDIMPDGRIVGVGIAGQGGAGSGQIRVVLNWFEELKRLVPTK